MHFDESTQNPKKGKPYPWCRVIVSILATFDFEAPQKPRAKKTWLTREKKRIRRTIYLGSKLTWKRWRESRKKPRGKELLYLNISTTNWSHENDSNQADESAIFQAHEGGWQIQHHPHQHGTGKGCNRFTTEIELLERITGNAGMQPVNGSNTTRTDV